MNLRKAATISAIIGTISICGCVSRNSTERDAALSAMPQKHTEIYLQEPFTRVIAHCYASAEYAAEACAKRFEKEGYVRFSNIPYKTARFDFLTKDTYPTRRWREHELTPRW